MKYKLIAALALLTVILVVVALRMQGTDRVTDLESRPLLSEQQLAMLGNVNGITVGRSDNQVELAREDGGWVVVNHDGYPVLRERMAALLHAIRGARVTAEQTDNPAHHARLGLSAEADTPPLRVDIKAQDGQLGLLYGNEVGSGQLVRFADEDQVLLVNRPFNMTVNSVDWLALDVIGIPMERAAVARWEHADGELLELDKEQEGDYNFRLVGLDPAQQAGNERWINSMVLALINLRAQNVALRSNLELGEPMLRMYVRTWDDAELQASLFDVNGRFWLTVDRFEQPDGGTLGVNTDERWAFQLGVAQMENLNRRRDEIVRTPEATAE